MMSEKRYQQLVSGAVKQFWRTRRTQRNRQGRRKGTKDVGNRGAVTGGAQMNGFLAVITEILHGAGISRDTIHCDVRNSTYLPGFFRPTKSWDLLVVADGSLLACIEFKSQVGSFGNNFNNRTEESVGSAHDFWTAYREGAFVKSPRPWLGFFMLLEEAPASTRPVDVKEPHFPVFEEFRDSSYAKRYEVLCLKLIRERLYDGACLLLPEGDSGVKGRYREPNKEVSFPSFARSLSAHAMAYSGNAP